MMIELLQIVLWFHPLIYILKHHIKLNHEFLADQAVLAKGAGTKTYQNILLQFSSNTDEYQFSSAINYSSIKKRFTVMKTKTSKTRIWLSMVLLLPIIAILFYSFAEREYVQKYDSEIADPIKAELEKANDLQVIYLDGASEKLMQEYRNFISKYKESNIIIGDKYERAVIIYDELMSDKQRSSVEKYPEQRFPLRSLSKVEPKQPTSAQFESWKDGNKFAIWIDSKHVPNSELNNYAVSDIEYFIGSKVYENARSKKFPQPFQFNLYTKKGFQKNYKQSDIIKYRKHTERYSKGIETYLKGSQTDNSELKILKVQADKLYNSFTREELKNYNILPAPPVPAEKKFRSSQPKTSRGGPNFENTQETYNPSFLEYIIEMEEKDAYFYLDGEKISSKEAKSIARNNKGRSTEMLTQKDTKGKYIVKLSMSQEKVTQKQLAEYNTWAKKIHDESKPLTKDATWFPPIDEQDLIKFSKIYKRMSPQQKKQAVDYPFPGLDVKSNDEKISISPKIKQQKATKEEVAEYNKLAKHCNSQLESEFPIIKVKDVKRVEYLYGIMSEDQKKNAESFPDFSKVPPPPPPPPAPERATVIEIAEYDVWAKKMNAAIKKAESGNNKSYYPRIKKEDYDKYYNIYSNLMTEAHRETAEPWPNIPPPPPPPPAPNKTKGGPNVNLTQQIVKIQPIEIIIDSEENILLNGKNTDINTINGEVKKLNQNLSNEDHRKYVTASIALEKNKNLDLAKTIQKQLNKVNVWISSISYNENQNKSGVPKKPFSLYSGLTLEEAKAKEKKNFSEPIKIDTSKTSPWKVSYGTTATYEYIDDDGNSTGQVNLKLNNTFIDKTEDGEIIEIVEDENNGASPKYSNMLPIVNGKTITSGQIKMTLLEVKKIKLTLLEGDITDFKFKIPGIKTTLIKGNRLTAQSIKNLNTIKPGYFVTIFDIKDNNGTTISPVAIEIIE